MIKIARSILSADFAYMGKAVRMLKEWGADYIHCDVMDGIFVPNLTFGMPMVRDLRKETDLTLDVHLMIDRPERYIDAFAKAGADIITVHQEATENLRQTLKDIKSLGKKCGPVIQPGTPVEAILDVLDVSDIVLVMSVQAGFGGQTFKENAISKIAALAEYTKGTPTEIEVDGGINIVTARKCVDAGANVLVAGSAVFSSENPAETIELLRCGH